MGLFSGASQFDGVVEKATSDKNLTEDWSLILDVCDKVGKSSPSCKDCLHAIIKRLNHSDPHVAIQAVTLLDACVNNCGKNFHLEIASRDFETEFRKLLKKCHPKVAQKLRESLKKWAEGEFKADPQLNLIPTLYAGLKKDGQEFSSDMPTKKNIPLSKDPDVLSSQEEEDQIAKAIELSLKETSGSPRTMVNTSLYPSTNLGATGGATSAGSTSVQDTRKVRALYDFEAAEDNELTFNAGEIIHVIDDSDPNWWKGQNKRGEGLFPANFVTADLSVEPEQFKVEQNNKQKTVQFTETVQVVKVEKEPEEVEINEEKIDRLLYLLHEADPTDPHQDPVELTNLECEVNNMGPLIDTELERVDRKHAQLTQLSSDLVEALNLYHTLMREPSYPTMSKVGPYGYPTHQPPPHMMYNGVMPPPPTTLPQYMNPGQFQNLPPSAGPQDRHPVYGQMPPPQTSQQQQASHSMTLPPNFHMQHPNMQSMPPNMGPNVTLPRNMPSQGLPQPPPQMSAGPPPGMIPPQAMSQMNMPQFPPPGMHQAQLHEEHSRPTPPHMVSAFHPGLPSYGQSQSGFQPISGTSIPTHQQTSMVPQSGHFPTSNTQHIIRGKLSEGSLYMKPEYY